MKKIKITIISISLFLVVYIASDFLLKKIPSIYYGCFSSLPGMMCRIPPWGLVIPPILGLGIAIYYFYRNLSFIKSKKKDQKIKG